MYIVAVSDKVFPYYNLIIGSKYEMRWEGKPAAYIPDGI
jgi:hypothetical protein